MNIKSFLLGSVIRINQLNSRRPVADNLAYVSHIGLVSKSRAYTELNYKELKALVSATKIKGRSRLTTKAKMIAALRALK